MGKENALFLAKHLLKKYNVAVEDHFVRGRSLEWYHVADAVGLAFTA